MQCRVKQHQPLDCIQWTGENYDEIKSIFGGLVGKSPFDARDLAMRGGDAYIVIPLTHWILTSADGFNWNMSDEDFKENYEILEPVFEEVAIPESKL